MSSQQRRAVGAGPDYYRGVLTNMKRLDPPAHGASGTSVRFSNAAAGGAPNYQIETSDGIHAISGTDHQPDPSAIGARYWESELDSEEFSITEVVALLHASQAKKR